MSHFIRSLSHHLVYIHFDSIVFTFIIDISYTVIHCLFSFPPFGVISFFSPQMFSFFLSFFLSLFLSFFSFMSIFFFPFFFSFFIYMARYFLPSLFHYFIPSVCIFLFHSFFPLIYIYISVFISSH